MKMLMLSGAMIGFSLGIALGFAGRAEWPTMLWHASTAAVAIAWLMRWWGRVWIRELQASLAQRRPLEPATHQHNVSISLAKK